MITSRVRPPGMHDVAKLAGVSHQTVSRVLNEHPSVREETRARVRWAIGELGYRRNVAARALVTRRSSTIGVITSSSSWWGPSGTLLSVEQAARAAGYYVSVAGLTSVAPADVREVVSFFVDQGVDGMVVIAPEAAMAHAAQPFFTDVPVVMVAAGATPVSGIQVTSVDQEQGARLATRHLIDLGHTDIAHIAGPEPWFDALARQQGWRRELASAGLPVGTVLPGDWSAGSGHAAGVELIRRGLPSAVFVANDLMAQGLIRALHDADVDVPGEVSVVGFDDMPGVAHLIPGLTTVRQDLDALGRQCIDLLLSAMRHEERPLGAVPAQLIVRESTAAPRARS